MRDIYFVESAIKKIKDCKTVKECAVVLRTCYDELYFHIDRTKQGEKYGRMNVIFVEFVRRIEELEKAEKALRGEGE